MYKDDPDKKKSREKSFNLSKVNPGKLDQFQLNKSRFNRIELACMSGRNH